jgi:hypothetical protein
MVSLLRSCISGWVIAITQTQTITFFTQGEIHMVKKFLTLFAFASFLVAGMLVASPAAAWSGIEFNVKDSKTNQPWGTVDGQQYRIIMVDGTTTVYNSGWIVTPSAGAGTGPALAFTCVFGDPCPALANANETVGANGVLPIPVNSTVRIFIAFDGTVQNPPTKSVTFEYFGDFGAPYTINIATDTGPTAVTLNTFDTTPAFNTSYAIAALFLVLGGASLFALRRQTIRA